ncbi:MAG: choice-of-anchor tandem repeat NxxGxxAF-containing protein [Thermodesulfobacteriota bacterium]
MYTFTKTVFVVLISGLLFISTVGGCGNGGGGDEPFPPPNALAIRLAQRGQTAPDGQATFIAFLRLAGPSKGGVAAFLSLERITEDVRRLVLYLADTSGLTEVARNGEPAPGGGIFRGFPQIIGVNDQAEIAFIGRVAESPDDEFGDTEGYYLGSEEGINVLVREGDAVPGGGTVFKICLPGFLGCFYNYGNLNESGQISYVAALKDTPGGDSDNRALYIADSSEVTEIARKGDPVPGGNGVFEDFFDTAGPNENGQVAFIGRISGSSGGESDNEGIYLAAEGGIIELAREGNAVPGGNGIFGNFQLLSGINDSGQAAFSAHLDGTTGGETDNEAIYLASEEGLTELVRKGEPVPGGGGDVIDSEFYPRGPNENGQVAFGAGIRSGDEDVPIDSALFLAGPSGITTLIRHGDPGPGGVGQFAQFGLAGLNDSGQIIFRSRLFEGKKSAQGLYRVGPGEEVTALAQQFQPAPPDGSKLFRSIEDNRYRGPSESGLAFFVAGLMNADRSYSIQDTGIFLAE